MDAKVQRKNQQTNKTRQTFTLYMYSYTCTYPLARGSSSFFLVFSPGSDFFFMYLINLESSCSNATNTGLICLRSRHDKHELLINLSSAGVHFSVIT